MAEPKTRPTKVSVAAFLSKVADEGTRRDCRTLVKLMEQVTGAKAVMWGPSIVGFGTRHYVYASGREGDWPLAAFSPRKKDLTLYFMPQVLADLAGHAERRKKFGPFKNGKSCLYVKRLADIDMNALNALVTASVRLARRGRGF